MNSWWLWLVVGMVLGGGPVWLLISWLLDRAYADGWDQCSERIKFRQAKRLLAGQVLMIDEHGPYWHDPGDRRPGETHLAAIARDLGHPVIDVEWEPAPTDQLAINARYKAPGAASPAAGQIVRCAECGCEPYEGDADDRRSHVRECPIGPRARGLWPPKTPALVSPQRGRDQEPPGPVTEMKAPQGGSSPPSGPGDLFGLLPDDEAFAVIKWEFARLAKMVAQPYKLTEWRAA